MPRTLAVIYKLGFAALVVAAVAMQFYHGMGQKTFSVLNFFSFFTIESNIFAAVMFVASSGAVAGGRREGPAMDFLRGAATLYMVITGIIYVLLLSGTDVQTPLPWVNATLHYIFPAVVLIDWLIDRPSTKLSLRKALLWLVFPLAYATYSLLRGQFAHWYPYPFINVILHGYGKVILNCLILAVAVTVLAIVIARISRPAAKQALHPLAKSV